MADVKTVAQIYLKGSDKPVTVQLESGEIGVAAIQNGASLAATVISEPQGERAVVRIASVAYVLFPIPPAPAAPIDPATAAAAADPQRFSRAGFRG